MAKPAQDPKAVLAGVFSGLPKRKSQGGSARGGGRGSIFGFLWRVWFDFIPDEAVLGMVWLLPFGVWWYCAFLLRVLYTPTWTTYVPVVSPVFGSGLRWWGSEQLFHAACWHVAFTLATLFYGTLQLDRSLRTSRPQLHRLVGWLYVASGVLMLGTLRPLREHLGGFARPGDGASLAMMCFVDTMTAGWLLSVGAALFQAAVRRDFDAQRRWTVTSLAVAMTPIAQQCILIGLVPLVMATRLLLDAAVRGVPFWKSAWGAAPAAWGPPAAAGPAVLSLEGYGVAENWALPLAGWLGLLQVLYLVRIAAWVEPPEPPISEDPGDAEDPEEAPAEAAVGYDNVRIFDVSLPGSMKYLVRRLPVFVGVFGRVDTREAVTGLWELATRLVSHRWASTAGKLQARAHCALVGEAAIWAVLLAVFAALCVAGLVANVAGTALLSWVYLAGVEAAASCAAWPVYLARVRWAPLDVVVNSTTAGL